MADNSEKEAEKSVVNSTPAESTQAANKILQETTPAMPEQSQTNVAKPGDAKSPGDKVDNSGVAGASTGSDLSQSQSKRAEETQTLVESGKLPGVVIDFGRAEKVADASKSEKSASDIKADKPVEANNAAGGRTEQLIDDKHAAAVVDQVKKLEVRHSSVDHVSGEVHREPARNNEVASLASSLSVLGKDDIAKVDAAYGGKGALKAIEGNTQLTEGDREKLGLYAQGSEKRQEDPAITTRLAELAIQKRDINDFKLAFAGAPESARQAFFANKDGSPDQGQKAIDRAFAGEDRITATEFAKAGKVSAVTEIRRETGGIGSFTNYEGVERTLKHLTPEETAQLGRGAALAAKEKESGAPLSDLTAQQKEDLGQHKALDAALQKAAGSNSTRLEYWRGLAQAGGQSNQFIDSVAGEGGRLYNGSLTGKLTGNGVEQHLKDNWDKQSYDYYNDPVKGRQRQEQAHKTLSTFSDGPKLVEQFDKQVKAPSFEESSKLAGKPQTDKSLLPELKNLQAVTPDGSIITAPAADVLRTVEKNLQADPKLQERIAAPKTEADTAERDKLRDTVASLVGNKTDAYQQYLKLERGEKVSPETWSQFDKSQNNNNHRPFFEDLGRQSQQVRDSISADPAKVDKLTGHLDKDNRQIAEQILKHGYQPADQLQAAKLMKDSKGVEEAIRKGTKENAGQFKADFESRYGRPAEEVAKEFVGGQKGIELERALASDKSTKAQFQLDQKIKDELHNPVVDSIATIFGSNAPRREQEAHAQYAGAVARDQNAAAQPVETAAHTRDKYRDERDALNTTEKEVVNSVAGITLTATGAALTGGTGFVGLAALREGTKTALTQYGTLSITSAANTYGRSAALGRLHDGQASTYIKDATDGAVLPYLGGGNLGTLGLGRIGKAAEQSVENSLKAGGRQLTKEELAAIKKSDFVTGVGHTAYPFSSNFAYTAASELSKGEAPGDALWKAANNGGLATIGVGSTWAITRGAKNFAPEPIAKVSKDYIANSSLSTAANRAGAGGSAKAEGNEAKIKKPEGLKSDDRPEKREFQLPGAIVHW